LVGMVTMEDILEELVGPIGEKEATLEEAKQ
jgi:CBS domain containing-hemolysin-like protein